MRTRIALTVLFLVALTSPSLGQLHLQWQTSLPERQPAWQFTQRMSRDTSYPIALSEKLAFIGCEHNGALLALDAETGEERWRFYTNGPIRVAPLATDSRVFVGSEDGYLYCLDQQGKLLWKSRGGPSDRKVIGHDRIVSAWPVTSRPVLDEDRIYFVAGAWPVDGIYVHCLDAKTGKPIWSDNSGQYRPFGEMFILDEKLFVRGHHGSGAYDLETGTVLAEKAPKQEPPTFPETPGVPGGITDREMAGDRVLVATNAGGVFCFGPKKTDKSPQPSKESKPPHLVSDPEAAKLLIATIADEGYCLLDEINDAATIEGLLAESKLHVVAAIASQEDANKLRRELGRRRLFETHRVTVLTGNAKQCGLPPYFANLVVTRAATDAKANAAAEEKLIQLVRPYGGALATLDGDRVDIQRRDGALAGSSDWQQEFFDATNCLGSSDSLVRAPLGLLWYGGEAADARFYFDGNVDHQSGHGLNPQPVPADIVEGRMILQGPGLLGAIDIYTGRILWESPLPKMYTFGGSGGGLGIHSKKHPEPWRHAEALKYEVPPTHRARASGFNFASLHDGIYVAAAKKLLRFDPEDGSQMSAWPVPLADAEKHELCWGGLRISGDALVATVFRPQDLADAQAGYDGNGGDWAGDRMRMSHLVALDRQTGELLWTRRANRGFINRSGLAVGGDTVFCVDLVVPRVQDKLREAGHEFSSKPPMLYALDLKTGEELWSQPLDVLVRNIAYSEPRDILLVPCRNLIAWQDGNWKNLSIDARRGKTNKNSPGVMRALRGRDGQQLWEVADSPYHHPHIVLGDLIIDRYGFTYDLLTGQRHVRTSPLTGEPEQWSFRKGGCNHLVACQNLVTWRTAFYDLSQGSGVMKLAGMDAGCSPTLLPAGGVLNIPNFGTHHKRNRMTAMALVHRPNNELWTAYATSREKASPTEAAVAVERAGYNFGAPGDRIADDGTLWMQVSSRNRANLKLEPSIVNYFSNPSSVSGSWITSSGVTGAESIRIPVIVPDNKSLPAGEPTPRYTVRLHFAEPEHSALGQRVFNVAIQGETVLENFDIAKQSGGRFEPLVREFKGIEADKFLEIALKATRGEPLLSGVELIRE